MKRIIYLSLLAVLLAPGILLGQTESSEAKAKQELIAVEDGLNSSLLKKDIKAFNALIDDRIMYTDSGGNMQTKAEFTADFESGNIKVSVATNDQYKIELYGSTAIVSFRLTMKGQYKDQDISGKYRNTDTWIKRDGQWMCIASHFSKIEER